MNGKIIIVDDDRALAQNYEYFLGKEKYNVEVTHDSENFFQIYTKFEPDLILLDIRLNNSKFDGIEIFRELKSDVDFESKVIVLSGEATRSEVAQAMQLGAFTFIDKSQFELQKFLSDVRIAINSKRQEEEIKQYRMKSINDSLIGESRVLQKVKRTITKIADHDVSVLITGETGTGKEVVARLIHENSRRKNKKLLAINTTAITETLFESQFFGYKKGSFTGAIKDHDGFFKLADGGTLFLDEIGDLSLPMQAKLLRVLQEKKVLPVGSQKHEDINVRMIFATNKNLHDLISDGKFREDLFYRMGTTIELPSLVTRGKDVILLMEDFLTKEAQKRNIVIDIDFSVILSDLLSYHWPGNIREFMTFCENLSIWYDVITNDIIKEELRDWKSGRQKSRKNQLDTLLSINNYRQAIAKFDKLYLDFHMNKNAGNVDRTADSIGLDRSSVYKKLKKIR